MEAVLLGHATEGAPSATALRASLAETGVTAAPRAGPADRLPPGRHQAALRELGRAARLLPLLRHAGRPPRARPARRGPRHLAAQRRALRRAAGAQPPAGLRQGPRRARPLLPAGGPARTQPAPAVADVAARGRDARPARRVRRIARPGATSSTPPPTTCRAARATGGCGSRSPSSSASPRRLARRLRAGDPVATRVKLQKLRRRRVSSSRRCGGRHDRARRRARRPRRGRALVRRAGTSFYRGMKVLPRRPPRRHVRDLRLLPPGRRRRRRAGADAGKAGRAGRLARPGRRRSTPATPTTPSPACCSPPSRATACAQQDFMAVIDGMEMDTAGDRRARPGDARPLLRPGRRRGGPALGARLRRRFGRRRRGRLASRPRPATDQHPARRRRRCRPRPALPAARMARGSRRAARPRGGAAPRRACRPSAPAWRRRRTGTSRRPMPRWRAARQAPCARPG